MMTADSWLNRLEVDPIPSLLSCGNEAIVYFTRRDLLGEKVTPVKTLWELPQAQRMLRRQREDGSWQYPGGNKEVRSRENYDQLETYRMLGELVEKFGFNNKSPAIKAAAEFIFAYQTEEGDFRGIYGSQYTPNYSAGIMELLIKSGYVGDPRIEKGFRWLLSIRQDDGGWTIPIRTRGLKLDAINVARADTVEPDRSQPFSHLATGVVLRAFAAHKRYRKSEEARAAGDLLASRLFKRDAYPDRATPDYWTKVSFPFWFTDIVSALDSLSLLGFTAEDPRINDALLKLKERQTEDGLFDLKLLKIKDKALKFWICLAVCRIFKRL
jgi:hypothetical protein